MIQSFSIVIVVNSFNLSFIVYIINFLFFFRNKTYILTRLRNII